MNYEFYVEAGSGEVLWDYDIAMENTTLMGGAMAASWAAEHGDRIEGVVLLAAYPTKQLDADLTELLIYGSEDHVLNLEKVRDGEQYAPEDYYTCIISGGNHAQFGNYGVQSGDGSALITPEEQQDETVRLIIQGLKS